MIQDKIKNRLSQGEQSVLCLINMKKIHTGRGALAWLFILFRSHNSRLRCFQGRLPQGVLRQISLLKRY